MMAGSANQKLLFHTLKMYEKESHGFAWLIFGSPKLGQTLTATSTT